MLTRYVLIFTIVSSVFFAACAKKPPKHIPKNVVTIQLEKFSKDGSSATVTVATPKIESYSSSPPNDVAVGNNQLDFIKKVGELVRGGKKSVSC